MTRLLLVEDDRAIARGIAALLKTQGFAVDHVACGEEAVEIHASESYGAMILDVGLPGISGFEVLRTIRRQGSQLPVLVLTAKDAIGDRVRGLDEGADDYLTKPFHTLELLARIRALVRRGVGDAAPFLMIGNLVCDPAAQTAEVRGRRLELPRREWAVLHSLAGQAGKVVSRERLASAVFNFDDAVGTNALEVYIARLRKKLDPDGPVIRTFRGLGYMMETGTRR
ncbi:DNA-binding response regulator [Sphingomonas koreensis]|nr:DNA-binding response regulator [Sphingomonas koreensis]